MPLLARIEQESTEERGNERFRVQLASAGQAQGGAPGSVTILELSTGGFLIQTETALAVGAEISLALPVTGTVSGEIVWSSGSYFGGQFRRPIARESLAAALAASRVVWPNFTPTSLADRTRDPLPLRQPAGAAVAAEVLPLSTRLQIIVGASILLWALIAAATTLIWRALP